MKKNIIIAITVIIIVGAIFLLQNRSRYSARGEYISADTAGLSQAKPPQTVE